MTFGLKDIIYFMLLGGSIASIWVTFRNKLESANNSMRTVKKILFKSNGELALVTAEQCRLQKETLQRTMEKSDLRYEKIESELNELSKNVLIIMIHLKIDVDQTKKKGVING